jgi:hypothetical protein
VLQATGKLGMIIAPEIEKVSRRYYRFGLEKVLGLEKIKDEIMRDAFVVNEKAHQA